jgi:thiamine biosynthesis lipoprotein
MACSFEILMPPGGKPAIDAGTDALDEVDRVEAQLSVYDDASEVSRTNAVAAREPFALSDDLFALLERAARLTEATGGAFDVTAGALIGCWGFFRGPRRLPAPEEIDAALQCVGMSRVTLQARRSPEEPPTILYPREGLWINLGSIGKGYALDRAAAVLRDRHEQQHALLHGGFSSVYGMGDSPDDRDGWRVGLTDVLRPSETVATARLRNQGLGTSCTTRQNFVADGRTWGHILDPRTGWPSENGVLQASVVADSSAVADALATAFYVMGPEAAEAYCSQNEAVSAMMVVQHDAQTQPVKRVVGKRTELFDLHPRRLARRDSLVERTEVSN